MRTFRSDDTDALAEAMRAGPKSRELFETYDKRVIAGELDMIVAVVDATR